MKSQRIATTAAASLPGWQAILGLAQQTNAIPDIAHERATQGSFVVQDMYIDLALLHERLQQADSMKPAVLIYADVVHIPANYGWVVQDGTLLIVARRIEVGEGAQVFLNYRKSSTATLMVYAQEIAGALEVVAVTAPNTQSKPSVQIISAMTSLGLEIGLVNGELSLTSSDQLPASMLASDSALAVVLGATLDYAGAMLDSHPDIAGSMLQWIQTCAGKSPSLKALFLQSAALLTMRRASAGGVTFVPYLSRTLYKDLVKSFMTAALMYEQKYERFCDKNAAIKDRAEAAGVMLKNYQASTDFFDKQIKETQQSLDAAKNAVTIANNMLLAQQHTVEQAQTAFQSGLDVWLYEKRLEITGKVFLGIFEFATAIATLLLAGAAVVATGGAAAPAAGGAAAGAGSTAARLAELEQAVSQALDKADKSGPLKDTMELIGKLIETLQKTYVFVDGIVQLAKEFSENQELHQQLFEELSKLNPTDPAGDDLSASVYWSKFRLEAQKELEAPIKQDVPGARDYQLQLDTLVVYGQALAANQLSVVKLGQELARLLLQRQLSARQQRNVQAYIDQLNAGQQPNEAMIKHFFDRYQDVKRSLFVAVKNYTWAHKYWALRDSDVVPSMGKKVSDLIEDFNKIEEDYASALKSFNPPPQDFAGKIFVLADPSTLQTLREQRSVSWFISLDDRLFRGFNRVRVKTVRVWLEGVKSLDGSSSSVYVMLSSSGTYQDRLYGKTYTFTSSPLQRAFVYRIGPPGSKESILVDGEVAQEQRYDYFMPTPFTDWTITLPISENEDLDLSAVTRIIVEFSGTAIIGR